MDWTSTSLRVLRAVAEYGSFTAAAEALGYTQSAVSRQVAALEHAARAQLFERTPNGARITAAGRALLAPAASALDEIDRASQALGAPGPRPATVRVGVFTSAGAALLTPALLLMRTRTPHVTVLTREGATPSLVRSLRASTIDVAVLGMQPPYPAVDDQEPALELDTLVEGELAVAVPADSPIGGDGETTLAELEKAQWVASPHTAQEPGFGVWPALPSRPRVHHQARDWLTKLHLVASGLGVTTVPPYMVGLLPDGVRLVRVIDGPPVTRRAALARFPGRSRAGVSEFASCLRDAVDELPLP
jgi:DNA-binding transcriptional LysR family regulator